jgi:K+ transporter
LRRYSFSHADLEKGTPSSSHPAERHLRSARHISPRPEEPKHSPGAGTAVYMSGNRFGTPLALLHNLKHNKVLHEQVVLLTVHTAEVPYLANARDRVALEKLDAGFWRAQIHFGFMEKPDVPEALDAVKETGLRFDAMRTTFSLAARRSSPRASSVSLPGAARYSPG